tara:strand:+ start:42 stop:260 length:219 start_codon:yes stop_codon:yes gene_type:complete
MTFAWHPPSYYKNLKDPKEVEIEKIFRSLNKEDYKKADRKSQGFCERAKKQIREKNRRKAEEIVASKRRGDE